MAQSEEQERDGWAIFSRCWFGVTAAFPIAGFDHLLDQEIPSALNDAARKWIAMTFASEDAWEEAWLNREVEREERKQLLSSARRASAPADRPVAGHVSKPTKSPPTPQQLRQDLRENGACLFDRVKEMAGWSVNRGGPRILVRRGGVDIPFEQVGAVSSICRRSWFLAIVHDESLAEAFTVRLTRDHPSSEWGLLRYGRRHLSQLGAVERLDLVEHLQSSTLGPRRDRPFMAMLQAARKMAAFVEQSANPPRSAVDAHEESSESTNGGPRKRARSPLPDGWIYATDARKKYDIKQSTFQGYRDKLAKMTPSAAEKDSDSGQVRVLEKALREVLGLQPEG